MNKLQGSENILEVNDLSKSFKAGRDNVFVLKNINLSVGKGEFVSIMGPSGCGKSTLLYLMGGLDYPTKGKVLLNGKPIFECSDKEKGRIRRQEIGFVFQFYNLVKNLTVEENILLPAVMDGKSVGKIKAELRDLIDIIGLRGKEKSTPRELSGGQQQRVAIARAIINSPNVILADEPSGSLDSRSGEEVMKLFERINRDKGITVVQVTHSREAAHYGSRIINIKDGEIKDELAI